MGIASKGRGRHRSGKRCMGSEAVGWPGVSVVVCTYKRTEALRECLISLSCQSIRRDEYEVLVVDNNPSTSTDVQRIVQDFLLGTLPGETLTYLHCPTLGLSQARNLGVSEARGEVCCFIDDDAIAEPDWLEQITRAFAAHPGAGVVGGHVFLQTPQPRPKILKTGREQYWSEFSTPYAHYTEVYEWNKFPWGANWSARRKALLEIGGFKVEYGRHGDDYGGGEELVAAAEILSLGYNIAVMPQAQVIHKVETARFTRRHLWKTILSSTLVAYRMEKDSLIRRPATPKSRRMSAHVRIWQQDPEIMAFRLAAHAALTVQRLRGFVEEKAHRSSARSQSRVGSKE